MTDQIAALSLDFALDGERGIDLNGSESLLATARTVQTLFDHQHGIPSEEFVMQLERSLFAPPVIPSEAERPPHFVIPSEVEGPSAPLVIPSAVEGSPAAPVSHPQPSPRPAPIQPNRARAVHRWAAIAAALILLIGGAGALVLGPFDFRPTPEPSAIPAIGFGTVEASPVAAAKAWTVVPPQGIEHSLGTPLIADGLIYSLYPGQRTSTYVEAVDANTGQLRWDADLTNSPSLSVAVYQDLLVVAGTNGADFALVAYDGRKGDERWSIALAQRPVSVIVDGDRAFVLGSGNLIQAFDLVSLKQLWQSDLSEFDPDWTAYGGLNSREYFNGGRLGMSNGVLAVLTSNGRLVAVDDGDGSVQWANDRTNDGETSLSVVDDRFVVTAVAHWAGTIGHDPYSIPSTPVAGYNPKTQPCQRTIAPRTESTPDGLGDYGESIDSFDPKTGESAWGLRTHAAVWTFTANDSNLIAMIRPGWDPAIGNEDASIYCLIDGATGTFQETSGDEFAVVALTNPETGKPVGIGALEDGIPLWLTDIDPNVAAMLPALDLDMNGFSGFRWVQKTDGQILITAQDGTLIGLPENAPRWSPPVEATPTVPVDDVANEGWTAHGPDGIADYAEVGVDHVIADERVFRAFVMKIGGPQVQAIDADSGDVLWEAETEVKDGGNGIHMATGGDKLLVAGTSQLVALDVATGQEAWTAKISGSPVTMAVSGNRVLVLSDGDMLDAIDVETGQPIYSVDIQGEAQDFYPISYSKDLTGYKYRLAVDDGTVYAALDYGSVVAVDIETGTAKWWSLRSTPGQVQVYAIDGAVVVDQGDLADISATIEADSQAHRTGTPRPVASPSPLSGIATCAGIESSASPAATPLPATALDGIVTTYRGLDSDSGAVRWSMALPAQSAPGVAIDDGLLYEVFANADWPTDPSQVALCSIDPSTGQSFEVDQLSDLGASPFLMTVTSDGVQREIVGVEFGDGAMFGGPAMLDPSVTGPTVTIDLDASGGTRWLGIYDDAIYLSRLDGSLEKILIPAQ